jgi:10-carbomethoxy-13-deoxycarminomycin esterase/esterase
MGANASALSWPDEFVSLLVEGGRYVIRYDHRDTGRSTKREFSKYPYGILDLASDAVAVLDGYALARAHVLGLSMGGSIGQVLAVEYRERLLSLTVMMTAALNVDFVGNVGRALRGEPSLDGLPLPERGILEVLARRAESGRDRDAELAFRVDEWRALSGGELPFANRDFLRWETLAMAHAGTHVQPFVHALARPFPTERGVELRNVTTPTLVIQGMRDPLNPPPHGRHIADLIPRARLVEIPGMGHALTSSVHRRLAELVLEHTAFPMI